MDWLKITIDNNDSYIDYPIPEQMPMIPALDAAFLTIDTIYKKYPPPYTLMLSGGVDSQAMLYAWHKSNREYKTFSGVYNDGFNENDLSTLRQFSSIQNIPVNFVKFDLLTFLNTEHSDYVHRYRCGSPHMTTFMKMSEMIHEGTVIMSGNFIQHIFPDIKFNNRPFITKNTFSLYRYAKITKKSMIPFFFLETSELAHAFKYKTNELKYQESPATNAGHFVPDTADYKNKVYLYQEHGFPVIPQEYKMTGFELVKDYYDIHYKHLVTPKDKLFGSNSNISTRTFDLLLRNKYEAKYSIDKYVYRGVSNA